MNAEDLYNLLKKDIEQFNQWRILNLYKSIDFSGHDFSKISLEGAYLVYCNLSDCNFFDSNLSNVLFCHSLADDADFSGSMINNSHFGTVHRGKETFISDLRFHLNFPCSLKGATFEESTLNDCNFCACNIEHANFIESNLTNCNFIETNYTKATFLFTKEVNVLKTLPLN